MVDIWDYVALDSQLYHMFGHLLIKDTESLSCRCAMNRQLSHSLYTPLSAPQTVLALRDDVGPSITRVSE